MKPPSFPWPQPKKPKLFDLEFSTQSLGQRDFVFATDNSGFNGVSAIFDIGNRIGQAGADFGTCLNGMVQQFFRRLPIPFWQDDSPITVVQMDLEKNRRSADVVTSVKEEIGPLKDLGFVETGTSSSEGSMDEEIAGFNLRAAGHLAKPQRIINMTSMYDSRTRDVESSLVARGDLWRVEASHSSSTSGNDNSSLFLVQLGPVLYVRDATLLLPVHLSKEYLL